MGRRGVRCFMQSEGRNEQAKHAMLPAAVNAHLGNVSADTRAAFQKLSMSIKEGNKGRGEQS